MSFTRFGLIARPHASALAAMVDAAEWLTARGASVVVAQEEAEAAATGTRWPTAPREGIAKDVDVVIAFGGDGTLLSAASAVVHSNAGVPVLGVHLGHLGFLTEVRRAELTDALASILEGRTWTETRLLLEGRIERGDTVAASRFALNDIVITRGTLSRMLELDVSVNGEHVSHVRADGLIVATATGSTAYNLSAGGPVVHPSVDAVILTPIAPHTLTNRPIVLPASAEIVLRPQLEGAPTDVVATFDGQFGAPLQSGDAVVIRRADRVLQLLRTTTRTHFDMLREKLNWNR
ncbi:MAG TPA: NAD(+)/NADH kinase [Vicinamibacterales bacterium]|jgi:NAD+ kinase|nr:NAD(+)/NADH kinase [Vicinamibacterales bacterium]